MLPSATPVGSNAGLHRRAYDEEYTTIQKLICRVSNKVNGGGFGAATVERVGSEPPTLGFVVRTEPHAGERQQLGFEVCGDDFDVDTEANMDMQSGSAHRFGVVVLSVALLDGT